MVAKKKPTLAAEVKAAANASCRTLPMQMPKTTDTVKLKDAKMIACK
jgi:hypothetical protein